MFIVAVFLGVFLVASAFAAITQPVLTVRRQDRRAGQVDPARLENYVRVLSTELIPRDERHPEGLNRAAAYIAEEFCRFGGTVSEQQFALGGKTFRNIIASFGPETGDRIVVGAHYDVDGPFPGADDNASGVAGLLELARLFGKRAPSIRVDLAGYTLEEAGDLQSGVTGSAVHARSLKNQGVSVRAMFSLEMIGYFSDVEGSQNYPLPGLGLIYPSRGNFIAVIGKLDQPLLVRRIKRAMKSAGSLSIRSINAPRQLVDITLSDHVNFWNEGYPAVMITDTAFHRNKAYHSGSDTWERLDYKRMAGVVEGVHAAIEAFS